MKVYKTLPNKSGPLKDNDKPLLGPQTADAWFSLIQWLEDPRWRWR